MPMEGLPPPAKAELQKLQQKNVLLDVLGNAVGQQIVVCGDTSTGKSTTINFILGFPINFEARGVGTRRPCVISQVCDPSRTEVEYEVKFCKGGTNIDATFSEAAAVADLVTKANDPSNYPQYFDILKEKPKTPLEECFDMEPIFVAMKHKDFVYGLRLIDTPGLTRKCDRPMDIARQFLQPGNIAILVIGKDNPNNGGFPGLAAQMAQCDNVLFIQNFAETQLKQMMVEDNLKVVQDEIKKTGNTKLADKIELICTDYGVPKTAEFTGSGLWKEGRDQEDWNALAKEPDLRVQSAMWTHGNKRGEQLKATYPTLITKEKKITSGLLTILKQLMAFQFQGLDDAIYKLRCGVQDKIADMEVELEEARTELDHVSNQSNFQEVLAAAARALAGYIDTTVQIPTQRMVEEDEEGDMEIFRDVLKTTKQESTELEEEEGAEFDAWISKEVDEKVLQLLHKYGGFDCTEKLACLRSWLRLLDEFTGMLAFAPMQCVSSYQKREVFGKIGHGAAGYVNPLDEMVILANRLDTKSSTEEGRTSESVVSRFLKHFNARIKPLMRRDIKCGCMLFRQSNSPELISFLQQFDIDTPEERARICDIIEEVLIEHMEQVVEETINGKVVVPEDDADADATPKALAKAKKVDESGLRIRIDENETFPRELHWMFPFRYHYFNGQVPWKDLRKKVTDQRDDPSSPMQFTSSRFSPPSRSEGSDPPSEFSQTVDYIHGMPTVRAGDIKPGSQEARDVCAEIVESKPPKPMINASATVNLQMFKLQTSVYPLSVDKSSATEDYDCDVMKLLQGMLADVATYWMSSWKRLLQELDDIRVDRMVELTRTEVRRKKMIWNASMADSVKEVVNAVKVFMRPRGETGREMTTVEEIKQVISDGGKGYWPSLDEKSYNAMLKKSSRFETKRSFNQTFPKSADEKLGKDLARKRLCEEFVFVLLQLATNKVEQSELDMAKCSTGSTILAGPMEIVSKLCSHRLDKLQDGSGAVFRERMMALFRRDLAESMMHVTEATAGGEAKLKDCVEAAFVEFTREVLNEHLGKLSLKFQELQPYDFSILNGRFPIIPLLQAKDDTYQPVRKELFLGGDGKATQVPEEALLQIWRKPLRSYWSGLEEHMFLEPCGKSKTTIDAFTTNTAYNLLTNQQEGLINTFQQLTAGDEDPPNGDKSLAGGAFHEVMLRIYKANHAFAIDYTRPRLKQMMALVYSEQRLRRALGDSPKLNYRQRYGAQIDQVESNVADLEQRLLNLQKALHKATMLERSDDDPAPVKEKVVVPGAQRRAKVAEIANATSAPGESKEDVDKQLAEARRLLKHYLAAERVTDIRLTVESVELTNLPAGAKKYPIYLMAYWFRSYDWDGEWQGSAPVQPPAGPPRAGGGRTELPEHHEIYTTEPVTTKEDAGGSMRAAFVPDGCNGQLPKNLYPLHQYFLALSFWEKRSGSFSFRQFAQKEDICLCTLTLPLAYCMRNSKEWGHVMGFKGFSDNPPFEQENIAGKSKLARWEFTFKDGKSQYGRERGGKAGKTLGGSSCKVTIRQSNDEFQPADEAAAGCGC